MRLRRTIALLLCTLYLLATGSTAVASLLCPCNAPHHHTEHCAHHDAHISHCGGYEADCCGDLHETELQLYTVEPIDDYRRSQTASNQLVALCAATLDRALHGDLPVRVCAYTEQTPPIAARPFSVGALRAPPVAA
ncbi:MAG: hypothetical protein IKZ12_02490 [Alistipes sp.]|nr:hypothetical protein [Alistipes sp.]